MMLFLSDKQLLLERGTSIYFKITQLIAHANVSPVLCKFKVQVIVLHGASRSICTFAILV